MGVLDEVRMLTVEEASALICLSKSQVRTLLRKGMLPSVRFPVTGASRAKWLIPLNGLKEFIAKNSVKPS